MRVENITYFYDIVLVYVYTTVYRRRPSTRLHRRCRRRRLIYRQRRPRCAATNFEWLPGPIIVAHARKHHETATCRKIIVLIILPFFLVFFVPPLEHHHHHHHSCCRGIIRRHNFCPTQWFVLCTRARTYKNNCVFQERNFRRAILIFSPYGLVSAPINRKLRKSLNINIKTIYYILNCQLPNQIHKYTYKISLIIYGEDGIGSYLKKKSCRRT